MLYASLQVTIIYLFIFLFLFLFLNFVLSLPIFPICINLFTTFRIAFIRHLLKQISYCQIVLSDRVHGTI